MSRRRSARIFHRETQQLPRFSVDALGAREGRTCLPSPRGGYTRLTSADVAPITPIYVAWLRENDPAGQAAQFALLQDGSAYTYILSYDHGRASYVMAFVRVNPGEVGSKHLDLAQYLRREHPGLEAIVSGEMALAGRVLHVNEESGVFFKNGFVGLRAHLLRRLAPDVHDLIQAVVTTDAWARERLRRQHAEGSDRDALARDIVAHDSRWLQPAMRAQLDRAYSALFRRTLAGFVAHAFGSAVAGLRFSKDILSASHPQVALTAEFVDRMCAAGLTAPVFTTEDDCETSGDDAVPPVGLLCDTHITQADVAARLAEVAAATRATEERLLALARDSVDLVPKEDLNQVLTLLGRPKLVIIDKWTEDRARAKIREALAQR